MIVDDIWCDRKHNTSLTKSEQFITRIQSLYKEANDTDLDIQYGDRIVLRGKFDDMLRKKSGGRKSYRKKKSRNQRAKRTTRYRF